MFEIETKYLKISEELKRKIDIKNIKNTNIAYVNSNEKIRTI